MKHQKLEAIAIDRVVEDILEQNQRNLLIDIVYRSKRCIEDERQEQFDQIIQLVASDIMQNLINQEVVQTANESLDMIRYEQIIENKAEEEIIDDICDYNTTKAV